MGLSHREVNGRLVLAGVLRIFWGIDRSIRLREFDDKRPIATAAAARVRKERDRKAASVAMADVNGAAGKTDTGGIVKFRQMSNRLHTRPLSLDVEAAVRNLELRSAADQSQSRGKPETVSEESSTSPGNDAKNSEDAAEKKGTKIRSWKTMPPRVMEEKKKAVMINRERGSEQPSSLSPDLLRRTYPAVKSIESEVESIVEARLQGSSLKYSFI